MVAAHVVGLAWIYEEVGLGAGGDARFQERVGVLWEHHGVVQALNDLQAAFQVFRLVEQTCLFVAFGVELWVLI